MNRNQACSCGSGKRYKNCCGAVATTAPLGNPNEAVTLQQQSRRADPVATMHAALAAQQKGLLSLAESLYGDALEALPMNFDLLHMLGVVKTRLQKSDEAAKLLLAALPLAPRKMKAAVRHNLGSALRQLAEERGQLDALVRDPAPLASSAPFVLPPQAQAASTTVAGGISIIVTGVDSPSPLERTLGAIPERGAPWLEVVVATSPSTPVFAPLSTIVNRSSRNIRLVQTSDPSPVGPVHAAVAACTGNTLCFIGAGDRWSPSWLAGMHEAMQSSGAQWGFSAIRVIDDNGEIIRYGVDPEVDALLQAHDDMYMHCTPSLAFLSFNPVARGRNLVIKRTCWPEFSSAAVPEGEDPFTWWAWRSAQRAEPVYLNAALYQIPRARVHSHLVRFPSHVFATIVPRSGGAALESASIAGNPFLQRGAAMFWARQWQLLRAGRAFTMSADALVGCASTLGVKATDTSTPLVA